MTLTDLLRSRDDDPNDHIDSDTPRSGVATPQPDPSDKRLPGIMHSYFGQVGTGSSTSPNSAPLETPALGTESEDPTPSHHREEMRGENVLLSGNEPMGKPGQSTEESSSPSLRDEQREISYTPAPEKPRLSGLNPYPTPPVSHPASPHESSSEEEKASARKAAKRLPLSAHHKSRSESIPFSARRASIMNPLSSIVTASNVHAAHFSKPGDPCPGSTQSTPSHSRLNSEFHESPSYDQLKKLTNNAPRKKSIPPTPTRALSNTTAKSDNSGGEPAPAQTSNGQTTKPAKSTEAITTPPTLAASSSTPKGKLTVKIAEARGIRRSRDPYVVAVFQRNELVSKGPLPEVQDDHEEATSGSMGIPMGGIPISRSGSNSGGPMAIPMKSRQSSNASFSGDRDFKINGRASMTNPKWDTEAVL